jgi:CP family cyanate transporter-like MFS transporter
MQGREHRVSFSMHTSNIASGGLSTGRLVKLLCLIWLAGAGTRLVILAAPPVIPLIHAEMHPREAQIGLLISLPLVLFAVFAVPGSLLVARFGAWITLVGGMVVAAIGSGSRGAAVDIWTLYAATIVMGFGISIMQPALPSLVREWLPGRTSLGMVMSTNGMVIGAALAPSLTIPFLLPYLDQNWRLVFVFWAGSLLATAVLFFALSPRTRSVGQAPGMAPTRWWPDWKSGLPWVIGITYGSNISIYFGTNAFIPDYFASRGQSALTGPTLALFNGVQLFASLALLLVPEGFQLRRWPYLVFGPLTLAGLVGLITLDGFAAVACAGLVGFTGAISFSAILALPALLSAPDDVHRTAAGTYTISFTMGVIVPIISGAIWDFTGLPWLTFVPLGICAMTLTVFGMWAISYAPQPGA